jgi:hypothetical protein
MVLRLACQAEPEETHVSDLAKWLQAKGQKSVCLAGDMANGRKCQVQVPATVEPSEK